MINSSQLPVGFRFASFARARKLADGTELPQAIAHRGFKAKYPENTMLAFREAVNVGVHALETDIHVSKDGVPVLTHDPSLKRCFGQDKKVGDCDWNYLSTLRTQAEPHEPMPRLVDLLAYLKEPTNQNIWVLLDIKTNQEAEPLMKALGETLKEYPPAEGTPWEKRIVLGVWAAKYVPLCDKYLPGYPLAFIGVTLTYASQFFGVENASFNMMQYCLMGLGGQWFLNKARRLNRQVFAWTVNKDKEIRWCIQNKVDGIISDDPKNLLDVMAKWEKKPEPVKWWTLGELWSLVRFQALLSVFYWVIRYRLGNGIDKRFLNAKKAA